MPLISAMAGSINRRIMVQAGQGKKEDLVSKIIEQKRLEA
jgi:hypothetical protein